MLKEIVSVHPVSAWSGRRGGEGRSTVPGWGRQMAMGRRGAVQRSPHVRAGQGRAVPC